MKKCSYCGAEYPDDAVICPLDQTPFENVKAGSMGQKHSQRIGSAGYWLIFAGVPIAIIAILAAFTMRNGDIRGVSERALPYVLAFVPVVIVIGCRELYRHIPKRVVIPFGVVGWIIVAVLVMCRFAV